VTGGSRGIGKMIAAGFLSAGAAKVYITARKAGLGEATERASAQYDGECIALPIDIIDVDGCDKLAEKSSSWSRARHPSSTMRELPGARFRRIPGKRWTR